MCEGAVCYIDFAPCLWGKVLLEAMAGKGSHYVVLLLLTAANNAPTISGRASASWDDPACRRVVRTFREEVTRRMITEET